jgi:hypothetical protein
MQHFWMQSILNLFSNNSVAVVHAHLLSAGREDLTSIYSLVLITGVVCKFFAHAYFAELILSKNVPINFLIDEYSFGSVVKLADVDVVLVFKSLSISLIFRWH